MKKVPALLFYVLIAMPGIINAQTAYSGSSFFGTSLDIITGADNIAMGESFVANNNSNKSFFENPAAMYKLKNVSAFYDYRYAGWEDFIKDAHFFSAGVTARTNIGNFGICINQYTTGKYESWLAPGKSENKNKTIILSFANNIWNNLSIGINVKSFDRELTTEGNSNFEIVSNTAFLFDLGFLYTFKSLTNPSEINSNLSLGLSIQNFGTDYEEKYRSAVYDLSSKKLPRYLRAGFAYEINLALGRTTKTNLDFLLTCEYKNHLNPAKSEKLDRDYWGAGIEATVFKIVSLKAGAVKSPQNDILFDKNKFNWRYGAGLNIPIGIVGLNYPVIVKFDYANIPVKQYELLVTTPDSPDGTLTKTKDHLYSFSFSLIYNMQLLE